MYHKLSPPQESPMNLLTSPFDPNHLQYVLDNELQYSQHSPTQSIDIPTNNNSNNFMYTSMSLPNDLSPLHSFHERTCSPEMDAMTSNDFISRSPESSSSAESNLVSPPQQYYSGNDYTDLWNDSIAIPPSIISQDRRSSSEPLQFNDMKNNIQGHQLSQPNDPYLFNQFHIGSQKSTGMNPMALPPKALPIQIKRVTPASQSNRPVDMEAYRQQLDEKLIKVNFDDITVAELKEILRERGLSATGRKAELMARLREERDLLLAQRCTNSTASPALHRRVANMSLADESPKRHSRHYYPYSPQITKRHASISIAQMGAHQVPSQTRLVSSMPDTPSYLNDQFMNRQRVGSCLRNPVHAIKQEDTDSWTGSPRFTAPSTVKLEEINEESLERQDLWDEQMLQNFLRQI